MKHYMETVFEAAQNIQSTCFVKSKIPSLGTGIVNLDKKLLFMS